MRDKSCHISALRLLIAAACLMYRPALAQSGSYMRYQVDGNSNRCLGVDSTSTNTGLELYDCDDDDRRLWMINSNDQLVLKANTNRCAERVGNGFTVELQACDTGLSNQRWRFDGSQIRLTDSSRCMQYDSESFGTNVITRSCDSGSDQRWEEVDPSGTPATFSEFKPITFASDTTQCVGVPSSGSGTRLRLYDCGGDTDNDLRLWKRDGRLFRLSENTARCARREGGFGSDVVLDSCDETDSNQLWNYDARGFLLVESGGSCWEPISGDSDQIEMRVCGDGDTNQAFDYGDYDNVRVADSEENLCLTAMSTSTNNNFLELQSCSDDGSRLWRLASLSLLRLKEDPTTCAALSGSASGARLRLVKCFPSDSFQRWQYDVNGDLEMRNADRNLCMEYDSENSGEDVLAGTCGSDPNQAWEFGQDYGDYVKYQVASNTARCLGVDDTEEFTILQLTECDDDNDLRLWSLDDDDLLRLKADPNRCAERTGTGGQVELQSCVVGRSNQEWRYDGSRNELRLVSSNECMEYGSTSVGEDIWTYECNGESNQEWQENQVIDLSPRTAEVVEVKPRGNENRCVGTINFIAGTVLSLFTCDKDNRRKWYYDENSMLRLEADRDMCASRSSTSEGNLVRLATCNDADSLQKWTHNDGENGDYEMRSTDQCMQFNSENVGEEIRAYDCDDGTDQEWDVFRGQGERSAGVVFYLDDPDICEKCIGATSIGNGADLEWTDCATTKRDRVEWAFENDPSGATFWCLVADSTLCVTVGDPIEGSRLSIRSRDSVSSSSQLWFYDFVNNQITHSSSEELCAGVATGTNNVDITMQTCDSGANARFQAWLVDDAAEQEYTCDNLETRVRTDGSVVFLDSEDDCDQCITVTGCSDTGSCVNPQLAVVNCFYSDDRAYLKYWEEAPTSSGSMWCQRDVDLCMMYSNERIELVNPDDNANDPNLLWYFASANGEVSPRISANLCVSTDGSDVSIEECSVSSLLKKNWGIRDFSSWSSTCKPSGRDPGSLPGVFIHIDDASETNCDWCIGVDTTSTPPAIGLASCIDATDSYETAFREGLVPKENSQWCLDSDSSVCIEYDSSAMGGLSVMDGDATGGQMERWYFENKEITPLTRADRCVLWDCNANDCGDSSSRTVSMGDCDSAPTESREWKIVSANQYTCGGFGTSSVGDTSAAGLGMDYWRTLAGVVAPAGLTLAYFFLFL
mmetsp:Transcript_20786/g.44976  ORF Transcript_20786/g.44976 Transcript_20786/m.44976 type:complete len:1204 (+) Transcript_20786:307-3918(+)